MEQLSYHLQVTRRCTKCHAVKASGDFVPQPDRPSGSTSWCRDCRNAYSRDLEKRRRAEGWKRVRTHEHHRKKCLKKKYGITLEEYNRLFAEQGGVCCICGREESGNPYGVLEVEHDHKTKRVRGLVCHPCNNAIMWYESARKYQYYDRVVKFCSE